MAQGADQPIPASPDGRRHLPVAPPADRRDAGQGARKLGLRWAVVALTALAASLYAGSFFTPWWRFTLFAPQYPKGLSLTISLTGLSGDVHEIDMLNHYIGMGHLEDAAQLERALAGYGVGALGLAVMVLAVLPGRRLSGLLALPGVIFPATFVADSFYWLYRFGHHLDPKAPLRMKPFTPQLFGEGVIGQFRTVATPDLGLWLSLGALAALVVSALLRRRVCSGCARAESCGALCPTGFVGPGAGKPLPSGNSPSLGEPPAGSPGASP